MDLCWKAEDRWWLGSGPGCTPGTVVGPQHTGKLAAAKCGTVSQLAGKPLAAYRCKFLFSLPATSYFFFAESLSRDPMIRTWPIMIVAICLK